MYAAVRYLFLYAFCVMVAGLYDVDAAINIEPVYTPAVNDRFADDAASFIADGYDFSGVARADDGRWVTMISSTAFVSAYHWRPANGTSVTFYETNDPFGNSFTSSVQSTQRIGGTDIVLGFINTALPGSYANYDIFGLGITGGVAGQSYDFPVPGITAYMLGVSPTNYGDVSLNMSVAVNELEVYVPQAVVSDPVNGGSSTTDAVVTIQDGSPTQYEGQLRIGDSGGPLFATDNGSLTLVGVNWFNGKLADNVTEISGMSYLPNYAADIEAILAPVPEPANLSLLVGFLVMGYACFKRRVFS